MYLNDEQQRLYDEHVYLAKAISRRIPLASSGVIDGNDLYQAACFGLMQAAARFDPEEGTKFPTFAQSRIFGAVQDEIRDVTKCRRYPSVRFYTGATVGGDGNSDNSGTDSGVCGSILRNIPDPNPTPSEAAEQTDEVEQFLSWLNYRNRVIAEKLLDGGTLKEAANKVGISESRACQIKYDVIEPMLEKFLKRMCPPLPPTPIEPPNDFS